MKPETLDKLLAYLPTLDGPSRLADCRVSVAFRRHSFNLPGWDHLAGFDKWSIIDDSFIRTTNAKGAFGPEFTPINFTNSIDYALELVFVTLSRQVSYSLVKKDGKHRVTMYNPANGISVKSKHKGPAVAILIALLKLVKKSDAKTDTF